MLHRAGIPTFTCTITNSFVGVYARTMKYLGVDQPVLDGFQVGFPIKYNENPATQVRLPKGSAMQLLYGSKPQPRNL